MDDASLTIAPLALGPWMTNCFVVHPAGSQACWIIDAGFEPQPLIEYVEAHGLQPERLILTHAHIDHIAGLETLRARWPETPILIHPAEAAFLTDPTLNLSAYLGLPLTAPPADATLEHGQRLDLEGVSFEVRHTPGHSPGGITLYQPEQRVALVGDTLFAGSIGRTDFPTSDGPLLLRSIREQLLTLPDDTRVWPGHGPDTTIGEEKRRNPYLR